jgi:hypothetical protein
LSRVNTFIPADEQNLQRMLLCGKEDARRWLNTKRGKAFARRASG